VRKYNKGGFSLSETEAKTLDYSMFEKGYQAIYTTLGEVIKNIDWDYFSVVLYEEDPIFWEDSVITSEQFLIALADRLKKNGIPNILLLNGVRGYDYSPINCPECYKNLFRTINLDKNVMVFGDTLTELKAKIGYPDIKISLQSILEKYETLQDVLTNTAPVPRKIDKEKFDAITDIMTFSDFLIDFLKPPTLTEEMTQQLEQTSKYELASHMISSLSVVLNPASAVTKGLGYALKFTEAIYKRKRESYQIYLNTWKENVFNSFRHGALSEFIGDSNIQEAKEILRRDNSLIILTDTFENLQSVFIPFLIQELIADEQNIVLLVDSITRLDRFRGFLNWLTNMVNKETIKLASVVPTYGIFSEWFDEFFLHLVSERALYFNVNSRFLAKIFENRPLSEEAWVTKQFKKVREEMEKKRVAFVSFDIDESYPWSVVKPSFKTRIVEGVRWKFRRFKRRFSKDKEKDKEKTEKSENLPTNEDKQED